MELSMMTEAIADQPLREARLRTWGGPVIHSTWKVVFC
jgi:hypothetical protein